jgi:hypothetical protein
MVVTACTATIPMNTMLQLRGPRTGRFESASPCFNQACKFPGEVSTTAAGVKPSTFIRVSASALRSSTRLSPCAPAGRT